MSCNANGKNITYNTRVYTIIYHYFCNIIIFWSSCIYAIFLNKYYVVKIFYYFSEAYSIKMYTPKTATLKFFPFFSLPPLITNRLGIRHFGCNVFNGGKKARDELRPRKEKKEKKNSIIFFFFYVCQPSKYTFLTRARETRLSKTWRTSWKTFWIIQAKTAFRPSLWF